LDASMEWATPLWDLAATQIIIEEAGGRYRCLQERELPGNRRVYSAVFGKPAIVERLAGIVGKALE